MQAHLQRLWCPQSLPPPPPLPLLLLLLPGPAHLEGLDPGQRRVFPSDDASAAPQPAGQKTGRGRGQDSRRTGGQASGGCKNIPTRCIAMLLLASCNASMQAGGQTPVAYLAPPQAWQAGCAPDAGAPQCSHPATQPHSHPATHPATQPPTHPPTSPQAIPPHLGTSPRTMLSSTVSATSSALCPVAILSEPTSAAPRSSACGKRGVGRCAWVGGGVADACSCADAAGQGAAGAQPATPPHPTPRPPAA